MNLNMSDSCGVDRIERDISLGTGSPITYTELWWRTIILSSHTLDEWSGDHEVVRITCSQLYFDER